MREMKDSGVAWLGKIPVDWMVIYPKALFTLRKDRAKEGERQLTASQQLGIVYQDEYMTATGQRVVIVEKDFNILKHVEAGDFVISMRSFQGGLEYSTISGSISSAYVMLIPNTKLVFSPFFKWLFKSVGYIKALQSTSDLIRDGQAMRFSNFVQVPLFIAPIDEQKRIATYLDNECAKIDKLIANQKAQIEKLKQYKQSLITEVVTKGLDPTAPMKDSGVEWIGMICESFVPYRIKDILAKEPDAIRVGPFGSSLKGSDILESGDYWVYNQRIVLDNAFNTCNAFINKGKYDELTSFRVKAGDVLCTTRGSIGKIARVPDECKAGVIHPCIIRFRINDQLVNYKLLELIFNFSDVVIGQLRLASNATTIDVVYSESLRNVTIPLGAKEQQEELLKFLLPKCRQIDSLVEKKMEKIKSLIDYKKSLIYECVTGKKEAE